MLMGPISISSYWTKHIHNALKQMLNGILNVLHIKLEAGKTLIIVYVLWGTELVVLSTGNPPTKQLNHVRSWRGCVHKRHLSRHAHRMPSCFVLHTSPTLCAAGYCLKMSDVNRNTVHQNSVMHFLCIRTHPADRNREGSTWGGKVSGRSACWSSTMWLKRMAVKGPGGEGQNAQMQDCYVFYHENGTTLAINYWWTGDDG